MSYRIPHIMIIVICLAAAAESKYSRPELLLEPGELSKPDVARQFVIVDARSRADYEQEHIPNAHWVDHDAWSAAFGEGQDAEDWSQRIGELGIRANSKVVVYDDHAMKNAARIWWILRYWGVDDVRLLNGGWRTWKVEKFPTSADAPEPVEPASFKVEPRAERLAVKSQILDWLNDNKFQIVDARSEAEYCGTDPLRNQRAGAIPGARHLEWSDLIDQDTYRFKRPEELRRLFDQAGIDLSRPTLSHCQSGGRASVMAFGLELMGADDVRNYYRGWSEWGNAEDTPIEPGKKEE